MGKFSVTSCLFIFCSILLWLVITTGHGSNSDLPQDVEHQCQQRSVEHLSLLNDFYKAAVVEYKSIPIGNQTPVESVLRNVEAYQKLMDEAGNQNVDIIVFPEYGLTTHELPSQRESAKEYFVEIPEFGTVPCDETTISQILVSLSCSAKRFRLYTVVNLGELEKCDRLDDSDCPSDGAYHYNTNVVFDRQGAIISRYRKFHLYFEPQFNFPALEYSTFTTDFGVTFGLFTCFDIIFAHPAVELVAAKNVRNFAFPTAWVDELPFLTAIQAQSLWAQSNSVNLLAAGYHQPDRGSMGSGIYSGEISLNYTFNPDYETKLVISLVPKNVQDARLIVGKEADFLKMSPRPESRSGSDHFWLREDLTNCTYKNVDLSLTRDTICHENQFCCDFEYNVVAQDNSGQLKLLAFDGRRTVAAKRDWFEWQVCAILHCVNDTIESCTERSESEAGHPEVITAKIVARPIKKDYEQENVSEPALSLIDTHFRLIPQSYFKVRQWVDSNTKMIFAEAATVNGSDIRKTDIKTVALIQKVYGGRI